MITANDAYEYLCVAHIPELLKKRIGLKRGLDIQFVLCDFLEEYGDEFERFVEEKEKCALQAEA